MVVSLRGVGEIGTHLVHPCLSTLQLVDTHLNSAHLRKQKHTTQIVEHAKARKKEKSHNVERALIQVYHMQQDKFFIRYQHV